MRILSKFKDYYDSAMGLGVDLTIVFLRNMEYFCGEDMYDTRPLPKLYESLRYKHIIPGYSVGRSFVDFEYVCVFFCGKVYRGITIKVTTKGMMHLSPDTTIKKTFYSKASLEEFISQNKLQNSSENDAPYTYREGHRDKAISDILEGNFDDRSFIERMRKERTVISMYVSKFYHFASRSEIVIKSPKLSDVEFYKVFPPSQAFQEIDMYISGVIAGPNQEPLPISDKDRIFQHGFDKLSFRKGPTPGRKKFRTG